MAVMAVDADAPAAVKERLEAFAGEVLAAAMNRPVQRVNGGLYLRGLLEQGARKSLEPIVERLGGDADYQSMQQFVADSPWDPALVVRAVAERVAPQIEVEAWVLDDTGFPKDGKDSPGVKRSTRGRWARRGNCQIGVSVHAVGARGTVPLGVGAVSAGGLVCGAAAAAQGEDPRAGRFQDQVGARGRVGRARRVAGRSRGRRCSAITPMARTPGCAIAFDEAGCEYVLSVGPETKVFEQGTTFAVRPRKKPGRRVGPCGRARTASPSRSAS